MKTVRKFVFFLALAAIPAWAQQAPPISTSQLTLPQPTLGVPTPPQPLGAATAVCTSTPGNFCQTTYYFWLISEFTLGNSPPSKPIPCYNAPATLSVSNYCSFSWQAVPGANSYDVLMTSNSQPPGGTGNFAVTTGTSSTSISVQSNSLSSYTVNTFVPQQWGLSLTNEGTAANTTHLILRQQPSGTFLADLNTGGAGFSNPMTTLGDTIYENSTPAAARLAGSTSSTMAGLTQTGTGSASAAPAWTGYVGAGTNPVAATISSLAQNDFLCANSTPDLVNCKAGIPTDAETGTSGYTFPSADRGYLIQRNPGANNVTDTIPDAGSTGFTSNWFVDYYCYGTNTANTCIIDRQTSSTINGATSLTLYQGQAAFIYTDSSGSNWLAIYPQNGTRTIASSTATLGTSAISSGACASTVTVSASGVATTDNIQADFNANPTSTTGYLPGAMLTIVKWPTSGNVNFAVCNNTGSSITPGAITLNWRVVR